MTLAITALVLLFVACINALVESVVSFFYGLRKKSEIIAVIGINMITNPTMNYLLFFEQFLTGKKSDSSVVFLLEVLVVIIEWKLLVYVLGRDSKSMFLLSLFMNLISCGVGLLFFAVR